MALARLLWRIDADTGGFEAGARRMEESTDRVDAGIGRATAGIAAFAAGLTAAVALAQELAERINELDVESIQTGIDATLLGGDRAAALAVQAIGQPFGVGPEQYFDASEAVRDALVNRAAAEGEPEAPTTAAARAIGLDIEAFVAPELGAFERSNLLLDAILGFEGDDAALLQAASELGAGDLRDFISLAGVVESAPSAHPRAVAAQIAASGAALGPEQAQANAVAALRRQVQYEVGREQQSTDPWWALDSLASVLTPFDEEISRARGRRELGERPELQDVPLRHGLSYQGFAGFLAEILRPSAPPVQVDITDSTVGGIMSSQRVTDAQSDGRTASDSGPPAR